MKNKSCVATWVISRMLMVAGVVAVAACARSGDDMAQYTGPAVTPTVDYVESLDVYSAPHQDSFLNQLAMNYRSYAIYNARTSGYADMGELFANKAVAAFSGEVPFPESLDNWPVENEQESFELYTAYNELMDVLKNDASYTKPELAAEAQAKFDCWLSASASGQVATAQQCRDRFNKTMNVLSNCDSGQVLQKASADVTQTVVDTETVVEQFTTNAGDTVAEAVVQTTKRAPEQRYYPETRSLKSMNKGVKNREGVIIVNNVNVPEHLINPVPVEPTQPIVFNQNIYGGDKSITKSRADNSVHNSNNSLNATMDCPNGEKNCPDVQPVIIEQPAPAPQVPAVAVVITEKQQQECPACQECAVAETPDCPACQECQACAPVEIPVISDELVSREEFVNMMMAMREELKAINARLDMIQQNQVAQGAQIQQIQVAQGEKTMIKVQQIPLEPTQHVMEEVFEVRFDFNKATITPEYQELIKKLATATQENKNIKVSVVGHTDTMGSSNYNYALGGRRAEAVQKMLIQYGIPASQIVAVSAGEEGLAVPTPDNTPNAENRRVRVVKEIHYTEQPKPAPMEIQIEEALAE